MKQFLLFIAKILLVLLLSAFALDFIYTTVFTQSKNRNKVENVIIYMCVVVSIPYKNITNENALQERNQHKNN